MIANSTLLQLTFLVISLPLFAQERDTLAVKKEVPVQKQTDYFRVFTGGINALYSQQQSKGSVDLGVQSCHYYLVTGRRFKSDSIHSVMVNRNESLSKVYRGFHFYLLNRAAVNLDSIRSMASEYFTSLKASPLTVRLRKEIYLTKQRALSLENYAPVISLMLIGDGRAVPFVDQASKVQMGVSSHFYLTFSTLFKRLEFDMRGKTIDQGTIYFKPSIGIGYGTKELMKNISPRKPFEPILSTDWRLGFKSERLSIKDFSFLMSYAISDIIGPKFRAGVLLSAIQ